MKIRDRIRDEVGCALLALAIGMFMTGLAWSEFRRAARLR